MWLCFFTITAATLAAQLCLLAFGALDTNQPFAATALPSTLALLAVTIPLTALGLLAWRAIGFGGCPKLYDLLRGVPGTWRSIARDTLVTALAGLLVGLCLVALRFALRDLLPSGLPEPGFRGPLGGLAVSIGAAVGEEVWFRLGLMAGLVWALAAVLRRDEASPAIVWTAILILALVFGAAHIPQLASFGAATSFAVAMTILGNTLVGAMYGWFFWKRGLIAAISAHFWADIALHFVPAL